MAHLFKAAALNAPHRKGKDWEPPSVSDLQEFLPQYEIEALIACGGMGALYLGRQPALDRKVAIKVLPPSLLERDAAFLERFQQEARLMARLHHPAVVSVFEAGESADGVLFIVMEFLPGGDVAQLVASRGALPMEQAVRIIKSVCQALSAAHQVGVIHRDIKPSNILLDASGNAKVGDFGLATLHAPGVDRVTGSHIAVGTPEFMAPESRVPNAPVDHRADLYAVGCMLHYMLTAHLPHGRFQPASTLMPHLDKRLDAIVGRALQTDPKLRHENADALLADLALLDHAPLRTWPLWAGSSILMVCVVAVVLWRPTGSMTSQPAGATVMQRQPDTPSPPSWVRPYNEISDLPKDAPLAAAFVKDGAWFIPTHQAPSIYTRQAPAKNLGIRATFLRNHAGETAGSLSFRDNTYGLGIIGSRYVCGLSEDGNLLLLHVWSAEPGQKSLTRKILTGKSIAPAIKDGEAYCLEAIIVDEVISIKLNGKPVIQLPDHKIQRGSLSLFATEPFRDFEVLNLDGLDKNLASRHAAESSSPSVQNTALPGRKIFPLLPSFRLHNTPGKVIVWRLDGAVLHPADKDTQIPPTLEAVNLALCSPTNELEGRRYVVANLKGGQVMAWGDTDIDFSASSPWQKNITQVIPTAQTVFALNGIDKLATFPELRSSFAALRYIASGQVDYAQGDIFSLTRRGYLIRMEVHNEHMDFADCPPEAQGQIVQFWCSDEGTSFGALTQDHSLHIWHKGGNHSSAVKFSNVRQIKDGGCSLNVTFNNDTWQIIGGPLHTNAPQPGTLEYHWSTPSLAVARINGQWKAHGAVDLKAFEHNAARCSHLVFNDRHAFGIAAAE